MSTLERLSDARGTVEGKIVAIVLAVLLVMPVVGVTAFADSEADHDHGTPAADVVATPVVDELPDTGNQPISEVTEPEQPAVPTVVPEEEPAKEPADADEVRLGLDVGEGAALVYDGKAYGVADEHFVVPAGQDAAFTVRLDEGVALADDEPVVLKAADGSKDELVAVSGIYTIQAGQLAEGLTVAVAVADVAGDAAADDAVVAPEVDGDAADVIEMASVETPSSVVEPLESARSVEVPSITFEAWCTSKRLIGDITLDAALINNKYSGLLDEEGLAPVAFANASTQASDGGYYVFSHGQAFATNHGKFKDNLEPPTYTNQTSNDNCNMYDLSQKIDSVRFNQAAGQWEVLKGNAWAAIDGSKQQLVLYYRAKQLVGNDENEAVYSKDWTQTKDEWLNGTCGAGSAVTIYQYYDAAGKRIDSKKTLAFNYSNKADKENISVSPALGYQIDKIKLMPLEVGTTTCVNHSSEGSCMDNHASASTEKKKNLLNQAPILSYTPAESFEDISGSEVENPFVVPWKGWREKYYACVVAVKLKDATAESELTVNYLDKDGNALQDAVTMTAVLQGAEAPTWQHFLDETDGKVFAKDGYRVQGGIAIPKNAEQETSKIALELAKDGYAKEHFKAEIIGSELNLYFYRIFNITYNWGDVLPDGAVLSVTKPVAKPADALGVAEDTRFVADGTYTDETLAYVMAGDAVTAVYKFSGWKLNGKDVEPSALMSVVDSDIEFVGAWEALTFKAAIEADGKIYDGDPIETDKVIITDNPFPDETPEYYYKKKGEEGLGSLERPTDAGDYEVTVVWPATDTHPKVTADGEFAISKRPVVLKSASDTKVFDGQRLTKHEMVDVKESDGNLGFVEGQGVKITYTKEITNPGTVNNEFTYVAQEGTNLDNYTISTDYGTLEVTARNDENSKIKVTLVAASKRLLTYDGTKQSVTGLASVDAVMDGDSYKGSEQEGVAVITIKGATFTVSGYKTGEAATNAGNWNHNIIAEKGFIVRDANGNDVTNQFVVETASGVLEIGKRSVTLTSESATKYYDGTALTKPGVAVNDAVFAREATAEATGSVTDVADGKVTNVISMAAKDAAEGVNKFNQANYAITLNEGTLQVLPQSIDPDDSTTPVDPEDPDKPVDPSNPDNPYKGAKVGELVNRVYNGKTDDQAPVVTDINGKPLNLDADYTLAADDDRTNVRTVTVTVRGTGNYTGTVERAYEITPAPVTVIVDNAAKKYGEDDPAFTGTIDKLFTNDRNGNATDKLGDIVYSRTNSDEAVGTYEDVLTATVTKRNPNYQEPKVVLGTFTITNADAASISATGVTKTFDGQPASIKASTEDGWTLQYSTDEGDDKTWSTENPSFVDAGTYKVYVKATRSGHADAGPVSATVIINPAPITITVADASKVAGTDDPVFRGTIEGEVAGYPLSGVTYFRSNDDEGVGVYVDVLAATYDDNPNYAVTIDPGTFTITAMALPDNPPTPGPIDTIIDFLSTPIIGGTPGTDGPMVNIADDGTPLANIDDNDTPLAAFDHPLCWVHYYILLGIIITAIYGGGVIARRLNYNRKVKGYEDDVTGKSRDGEEAKRPVAVPTQA